MRKFVLLISALMCLCFGASLEAQVPAANKVGTEKMLERFMSYVKIESPSIDDPDMSSFPLSEGQKKMARKVYGDLKALVGKDVKVTLSDDYYVYVDIPSNVKGKVPSVLFMAHLDYTPDVSGTGIKPQVHRNYNGGDIALCDTMTLSHNSTFGKYLDGAVGKTIVTTDGSTLLGADDKAGCAVLVSLVEELAKSPEFKHGRVMIVFSQNEDVGKAALRYDPTVFGDKPDVVFDVDGDSPDSFSVSNFTAIGQTYRFKSKGGHPSHGKEENYGDPLAAAAYFIAQVPPELHPSNREGLEGYVHCYTIITPTSKKKLDELTGDRDEKDTIPIEGQNEYVVKVRLRYFDKNEGAYQKQLMEVNLLKTQHAFPYVTIEKTDDKMQYENIAYTLPAYVPDLVQRAARASGMEMKPYNERGGTTSAMMVARHYEMLPGGSCVYSGQHAEHSFYEWCCIEDLIDVVNFTENIITELTRMK